MRTHTMTRPSDYKTIVKDITREVKKAATVALRAQGVVRPGAYAREVADAAEMIIHDAAVVTSWARGGDGQ